MASSYYALRVPGPLARSFSVSSMTFYCGQTAMIWVHTARHILRSDSELDTYVQLILYNVLRSLLLVNVGGEAIR